MKILYNVKIERPIAKSLRVRNLDYKEWTLHVLTWLLLFFTFLPLIEMLFKSFKTPEQNIHNPWLLSFPLNFDNYKIAWQYVSVYIVNTLIITIIAVVLILIIATLSAFIFARFDFPGKEFLFMSILALMMVPGILTLIPLFKVVDNLKILNSYWAVILPGVRSQLPFGIFVLRTFIAAIPEDLFDAARIDGATTFQTFRKIAIPLSMPMISTLAILSLLFFWNDIIWPSIALTSQDLYTIAIGLQPFTSTTAQVTRNFGPAMAGYVITSIPLLVAFFFASKQFIEGMTSGALKL